MASSIPSRAVRGIFISWKWATQFAVEDGVCMSIFNNVYVECAASNRPECLVKYSEYRQRKPVLIK